MFNHQIVVLRPNVVGDFRRCGLQYGWCWFLILQRNWYRQTNSQINKQTNNKSHEFKQDALSHHHLCGNVGGCVRNTSGSFCCRLCNCLCNCFWHCFWHKLLMMRHFLCLQFHHFLLGAFDGHHICDSRNFWRVFWCKSVRPAKWVGLDSAWVPALLAQLLLYRLQITELAHVFHALVEPACEWSLVVGKQTENIFRKHQN